MDIDKEKQAQAMAKAKQSLLQAEIKREETRMNQSIAQFLQGNYDALLNNEFIEYLASNIVALCHSEQQNTLIKLIENLGKSILSEQVEIRERSLMVLILLSEQISTQDIQRLKPAVVRIAVQWLTHETEFIAGFETACLKLQRVMIEMLVTSQWSKVLQLIVVLNDISDGSLKKNNLIRAAVARVHDSFAEPSVIESLTDGYLGPSSQKKQLAEKVLLTMGQSGTRFLIEKLAHIDKKEDRLALIDLIPRIDKVSSAALRDYLQDEQPWFVTRNIIMIVSLLGDDSLYSEVEPHLHHKDIRVQQQVLSCIEMLGGENMKERLLTALPLVNDELKVHLVELLANYTGPDIESALLGLIYQREQFDSHIHDFLITKVCSRLVDYPSARTITSLISLIEDREEQDIARDNVIKAATETLQKIEQIAGEQEVSESGSETDLTASLTEEEIVEKLSAEPSDGSVQEPGSGLSDSLVESPADSQVDARPVQQDESQSNYFQTHLSQDHHLMIWSSLYEMLDTEEANSLFKILTPRTMEPGELLTQHGDQFSDLIFIDQGYVHVACPSHIGRVTFAPLQGGELLNCVGFFEGLPYPLTIQSQTEMQIRVLERANMDEIQASVPELMGKLSGFCKHHDLLPVLIRGAMDGKYTSNVQKVPIYKSFPLKDSEGETIKDELPGLLDQTSVGGFSIVLPYANLENVYACLGHQISAELSPPGETPQDCFGYIAGGGIYESSRDVLHLHIKLYHPLKSDNYVATSVQIM